MPERKVLVQRIEEFLAKNSLDQILNFCLGPELLNFAIFSLIFDARKKKISASNKVIPWKNFCFLPDS